MNTTEKTIKKNIYKYYVEVLCSNCINKDNNKDLCRITNTIDNTLKCINYDICMKDK